MVKILEFKEFKRRLQLIREAEGDTPDAADAPAAAPPPPPPAPTASPAPDLGAAPTGELPPDPNAAPASPGAETDMRFVFMDEPKDKKWRGHHDKDGGTKRFTQYAVTKDELTKWLDVHDYAEEQELIMAALSGKREMPKKIYFDIKNEVERGILGTDKGTIDINFDSEKDFDNPSTTDLDVVFLKPSDL
jgi:hypothetical protein